MLAILGALVLWGSLSSKGEEDHLAGWVIKTLLGILGAVVLFGLLLKPLGMVLSVIVLVLVSSMASHEFSWKGTILNAIILVLISLGAFVYGYFILLTSPLRNQFLAHTIQPPDA